MTLIIINIININAKYIIIIKVFVFYCNIINNKC